MHFDTASSAFGITLRRPPIGYGRQGRIIVLSTYQSNSPTSVSTLCCRMGSRRWDFAADVHEEPEKWRLHVATLEARRPFRGFVYKVAAGDGSTHYISASGKPVFDPDGGFLGYRGVGSDITASVRAVQAEQALHKAQTELAHVTRVMTLGELDRLDRP